MDIRTVKARLQGRIVRYEAARKTAELNDAEHSVAYYNGKLSEVRDILEMLEEIDAN